MKLALVALPATLAMVLTSCMRLSPEVTSQDCIVPVPAGSTRIFIGSNGHAGSGTSFDDPLDGSTAEKFDAILSSISMGQNPTWGSQTNIAQKNLIVCLTSGTFQTNGQYDWSIAKGHTKGSTLGFTVEENWKIHGRGVSRTTLKLASFVPDQFTDRNGAPFNGGRNVVIGTHSRHASGVEISDLTVDANHDGLTSPGGLPLNLEAIVLRSTQGGHWIHNVNVVGGSGDVGLINVVFETFAIRIWGSTITPDPSQNTGSIVESVTVSNPGRAVISGSPAGGAMDAIVVNNAVAEIKNNTVDGYQVAFGGWNMGAVNFHDNIARNIQYGFNADSFANTGVILQNNQFIRPSSYGIVIGGSSSSVTFSGWNVIGNTIQLGTSGATALVLRGQVQDSTFAGNTISADSGVHSMTAIWSYAVVSGLVNLNNIFQDNHIDKSLSMNLAQDPNFNTNCRFQNRDLQGQALPAFPDNSSATCK
ncbi:MAG TPA: hypothetical protein VFR84_17745 [Candidatus Angelobacter sp.]|nr:hypothetical protein [Candidatus Angelobacter sp.]